MEVNRFADNEPAPLPHQTALTVMDVCQPVVWRERRSIMPACLSVPVSPRHIRRTTQIGRASNLRATNSLLPKLNVSKQKNKKFTATKLRESGYLLGDDVVLILTQFGAGGKTVRYIRVENTPNLYSNKIK